MKRLFPFFVVILVFLLSSCSPSPSAPVGTEKGSLTVYIPSELRTKTIEPSGSLITCSKYKVILKYQQGQTSTPSDITKDFTGSSVTVSDMIAGKWDVYVEGYNSENTLIAKSAIKTITITQGSNATESFALAYLTDGKGQLTVSIAIPSTITTVDKVKIVLTPVGGGDSITFVVPRTDAETSGTNLVFSYPESTKQQGYYEVPTGAYDMVVTLLTSEDATIGTPFMESVHVYKGLSSPFQLSWNKDFLPRVATPTIGLVSGYELSASGTVAEGTKIEMSCSDAGDIYYTTDGSVPTDQSTKYTGQITINQNTDFKAIAIKEGLRNSVVASASYYVQVATPTVSVSAGTYTSKQTVSLTCTTTDVAIYYTLDGTDPTTSSTKYTQAIEISTNKTLKCVATKDNLISSVIVSAAYVIDNQSSTISVTNPDRYIVAISTSDNLKGDDSSISLSSSASITAKVQKTSDNTSFTDYSESVTYQWYVDGSLVNTMTTNTFSIGTGDKEYQFGDVGAHTVTVKVIFGGKSYTENISLEVSTDVAAYAIGATGPAGGIIFYDCDADNESGNADGLKSSECGWRYLEAAPFDARPVDHSVIFGVYKQDKASGIPLFVNGTTVYNEASCTKASIGSGKNNTTLLSDTLKNGAYTETYSQAEAWSGYLSTSYAVKYCVEFEYDGYSDWFLPSKDELLAYYVSIGCTTNLWTSTEDPSDAGNALLIKPDCSVKKEWRSNGGGAGVLPVRQFL